MLQIYKISIENYKLVTLVVLAVNGVIKLQNLGDRRISILGHNKLENRIQ